ncbi:MAG: 3-dehydroquinate synthase [Fermentimonas sp.]|jgi:3-dehydroquinate synthase
MNAQEVIKSEDIVSDIARAVASIGHDKLFVLTDDNTEAHCLPVVEDIPQIKDATKIVIASGDNNKTLESLSHIWEVLTNGGATRHSLLVNLGGGMITDIGGFAAATFKRGIEYINVPTTLLGAVDASVGGKTGINFCGYKNEVGSFYTSRYVIMSSTFLKTLPLEGILSGYAEMLKHALIDNTESWQDILSFSFDDVDYSRLNDLMFDSVEIKRSVVERDPYEQNIRKALNLGHTAGHAFESFALSTGRPIPHGYAVAWGIIVELYLSYRVCGFPKDKLLKTVRFIKEQYGAFDIDCNDYERLHEIALHDKKNEGHIINFTLLSDIGKVEINQTADKELLFEGFDFYRDSVGL